MATGKNIKGITIEINGDVTKLDKALNQVDKDLNTTQKNLKEVDRLLKLDPKNVELLDQKQRLLAQGVEQTSKRYETLKKTLDNATASNVQFEKWEKAQSALQGQISKTENTLSDLLRKQKEMQSIGYPDGAGMNALQREIDETRQKSETLRQKMAQTFEELGRPISVEQYDKLQRELVQSKDDMDKAKEAAKNFEQGTDQIGEAAESTGGLIGKLNELLGGSGGGMVAAAAAGGAAVAIAAKAIKEFAEWTVDAVKESAAFADEMLTLSQQTNFSTDFLQELDYAAGLVDVSTESIISAMRKLKQNLSSDSASVREAFERIGVIPEQLAASGLSMEEIFQTVAGALSCVNDELERDQLAMTIFGRGADELAGIIDDGGESLRRYTEEARAAGYVLSGEELQALGAVDDAFYRLDKTMELAKKRVAIELAPEILELTKKLTDLAQSVDWEKVGSVVINLLKVAVDLLEPLAKGLFSVSKGILAIADAATTAAAAVSDLFSKLNRNGAMGKALKTTLSLTSPFKNVPFFADGGVVAANNPMLAVVGDNKRDREIIAPESLIRQAIRDEAGSFGGSAIVVNTTYSGTDDQIVRALAPKLDAYWRTKGAVI